MQGWVSVHRKMLDNPVVFKDADHVAVWMYLLLNATHKECQVLFKGEKITLLPGQLITGRKAISDKLKISDSKVHRILKLFEIEQQIEQQTSNKNRLISIKNWDKYQFSEQQDEQQVNNNRTTSEQQTDEKFAEIEQQNDQQEAGENALNSMKNQCIGQQDEQQSEQQLNNKNSAISQKVNTNNKTINNNTLLCAPAEAHENVSDLDTGRIQDESEPDTQPPEPDRKTKLQQDTEDFELIYKRYPKKRGKAKAFEYYRGFVGKGRMLDGIRYKLDRREIYLAVDAYVREKEEAGTDLQFYQDFSTFMNKTILDYVQEKEDQT